MIQQISYYISKAGIVSAAGKIEDERRRLSEMPTPAAFVSYAPSLPALVGWYGYRVAFNGVGRVQLEAALDSLRRHFRLRDLRVGYDRFNGFYIMEALFAVRMNLPGGVFGGAQPAPEPDALNFYMPNGGTVSLNKTGSPTVVELEYCLDDNGIWIVWQPDNNGNRSLVLSAGQRMYVRNTSETQTGFSNNNDYYQFAFSGAVEAHGNTNSLLCKNAESVTALAYACYYKLFYYCTSLVTAPELPATTIAGSCYQYMFYYCTSLVTAPELPATTLDSASYAYMFYYCSQLQEIRTMMTDISASYCLTDWLSGVAATGDFYCPAELTISEGSTGIPSGWTRHDL